MKIIIISLFALMLTACVGEEPNNIAYITAVGIDKTEKEYKYTIQFANPTKISGGASEEGGEGGDIVENIAVEAPTLLSAVGNADSIVSKELSLSHAKIFVASEEVAREGLSEVTGVIARNNDIRPDVYLAVAENAGEYLEGVKPAIELNPVKYYQLTYEKNRGGPVPQNNAGEFYMSYRSRDRDCALPLSGVAGTKEENREEGKSGASSSGEEKPSENDKNKDAKPIESEFLNGIKNYLPGEAGVKVKNKSETMGLAIFSGDTYIGKLGSGDAYIYNLLMGDVDNSKATFYDKDNPEQPITLSIEEKRAPQFSIDRDGKTVKIKLKLEGELLSAPKNKQNENALDKAAAKMIDDASETFLKHVYVTMGADIIGIRGKLKRYCWSNDKYSSYVQNFNPREWSFDVTTELRIKRTGMNCQY